MDALPDNAIDALKEAFTFDNPQFHSMRKMKVMGWWRQPKIIELWSEETKTGALLIPRGGMSRVREILRDLEIPFKVKDARIEGSPPDRFPKFLGVAGQGGGYDDLHYYQHEAIDAAMKRENCVIRMPTGSGKSIMAIALATKIGLNTLVILPTVGLFKQWVEDAKSVLDTDDIGIIHQKKFKLRPITATVQGTLASQGISEQIKDYFGVVIVDECQKAPATSYSKVIGAFPSRYRIGISADERRQDRKEFIATGLFGAVEYEKKRKELEDEGFIVDVEIRVVPTEFRAEWYGVADEDDEEDDRELDFKRLIDEMTSDEERNKLITKFAFKEVDNGEQAIVLSHRVEHCIQIEREFVKRQVKSGYFIGGDDYGKEFEKTRAGIKDGSIRVGVGTYSALGVGVNLPKVGVGVASTPISGNRFMFNQVRGRLNRRGEGKVRAVLYVLWDQYVYPRHLANIVAWNPTVKVYVDGKWVEGRHHLKKLQKKKKEITFE